jgi:predicted ATPase/predicted Ser/Thr protein kinase
MAILSKTRLGRYEIRALLGAGGMGDVFQAYDTQLERSVAIKLLPAEFTENADRLRRFMQEAKAASALNHPNIITIHEIGEDEVGRFIVMELIEGRTLREVIANERPPLEWKKHLSRQIAEALSVAHAAGIIHRDIKPENIMVRKDGYAKILDFGVARLTSRGGSTPDADTEIVGLSMASAGGTTEGMLVGTLRYMSPEQARGEAVTSLTDIFSLGIVMYELMTGQHPFAAESQFGVAHAILSQPALTPSRLNPEIPAPLDALILQMLEKEEGLRPSAAEVETGLSSLIGKSVIGGPQVSVAPVRGYTVGRESELRELRESLKAVVAGHSLLVGVSGEPGLGKTTVVEEFLAECISIETGFAIARGRCSERLAGTEAYLPILEALESLLRSNASETAMRVMKQIAPTWYVQVISLSADDTSAAHLVNETNTASQERMKREFTTFLQEMSRLKPLVIFLDDLHWADVSTIDLLAYTAARFDLMRVLVVVTYRPSDLLLARHPFIQVRQDLQARGLCSEIPVSFLTPEEVARYLALEFPEHNFPPEFAELIHTKTEGNPLFMVDLARYLRDRKVIAKENGQWQIVHSLPNIEKELPESVRSMIARKIAHLEDDDLRLLTAASVQGFEFDSAVLAKVLELDPADVEERLDGLERIHSFVVLEEETEFPDHTLTLRYRFVHVLYQNALYATLKPTRRAKTSAAVAESLIEFYGEESKTIASELAVLFETARDFQRAADYFLIASQNAGRVFAFQEAITLARRGLKELKSMPDVAGRAERELALLMAMGIPLMATSGYAAPEVEKAYSRAYELCLQLKDTPQLFMALWGLFSFRLLRVELDKARELAEQMLGVAERLENPALMIPGIHGLEISSWHAGDLLSARAYFERVRELYTIELDRVTTEEMYFSAGSTCFAYGAFTLWMLGHTEQSLEQSRKALAITEELANPPSKVSTLTLVAWLHCLRREPQKTLEFAEAAMALASEYGQAFWLAFATCLHGWAMIEMGEEDEGIAELTRGSIDYRVTGAELAQPLHLMQLAEVLGGRGQIKQALSLLDEGIAAQDAGSERWLAAELHRVKGGMLLRQAGGENQNIIAEAEADFQKALEIARQQQAMSFELRAAMSLSRLRRSQGRKGEARATLAEVYNRFTEGFETADLREAAELLEELK